MRVILAAAVTLLLLLGAGSAMADTSTTTFEGFAPGTVNGQDQWRATGPYDQEVVAPATPPAAFGQQSLRMSSLLASGSFGDWVFSKPVAKPAAEADVNKAYFAEFSFKALGAQVDGSHLSMSPDNGQGARMSYVRLEDTAAGVRVFFDDVPNRYGAEFNEEWIATLDRSVPHTIGFAMSLVPGEANDVVTVFVDGVKKVCGTSWENYYRYVEHSPLQGIDRLILQARGTSTPFGQTAQADRGFLIDNVSTTTAAGGGPEGCAPPAPLTDTTGPAGATGATGATGAAGPSTIVVERGPTIAPRLIGNTRRVLHATQRRGERFLSVRATLRGLRLPVHGRTITVDLRGRPVGNYNVFVVARYRTRSGRIHVHSTHRSLSVTRALQEVPVTR